MGVSGNRTSHGASTVAYAATKCRHNVVTGPISTDGDDFGSSAAAD